MLLAAARFFYSAFLTVVCLLCPAVVIWLDPWRWSWANILFLVRGPRRWRMCD